MFSYLADKLNVKNIGEILAPTLTPEDEFHAAIENGIEDKFFHFLDAMNFDPNTANSAGHLPIHTASYYGRVSMMETLLSRNVDVNAIGVRDNTPLHFAASQGRQEAVRFLIDQGANPALRNRNGKTAYDVAKGDPIRQFLLPLQFRHEDPNQAAAMVPLGITPTADPMAPRAEIAPPPTGALGYSSEAPAEPQVPQHHLYMAATHSAIPKGPSRITRSDYRPIQADGFGSSVGNEALTAKFGNTREVKVTAPPPTLGDSPAPPAPTSSNTATPFAGQPAVNPSPSRTTGGYPGYAPSSGPTSTPGMRGPPQFKIFNPKLAAGSNPSATAAAPRAPVQTFSGSAPPNSGAQSSGVPYNAAAPPSAAAMTYSEAPFGAQAPSSQGPGPFMEYDSSDPAIMEEVNLSSSTNVMQ